MTWASLFAYSIKELQMHMGMSLQPMQLLGLSCTECGQLLSKPEDCATDNEIIMEGIKCGAVQAENVQQSRCPKCSQVRCWEIDSRVLTPDDARQVVRSYKASYTKNRFRWLMLQAIEHHKHTPDIQQVYIDALKSILQ